jgi:hypothetical protein
VPVAALGSPREGAGVVERHRGKRSSELTGGGNGGAVGLNVSREEEW